MSRARAGHDAEVATAAAARVALLPPAVFLHDHRHVDAHERPHVRRECAVRRLHEHDLVDAREARDDLRDARVHEPHAAVEVREEVDLRAILEAAQRVDARIQRLIAQASRDLDLAVAVAARDAARRVDGVEQRRLVELVGVCEARALARDRTHADALIDAVHALFHDPVLDGPGLVARELEVQVGVVELPRHRRGQRAVERAHLEAGVREQLLARDGEGVELWRCADFRFDHSLLTPWWSDTPHCLAFTPPMGLPETRRKTIPGARSRKCGQCAHGLGKTLGVVKARHHSHHNYEKTACRQFPVIARAGG